MPRAPRRCGKDGCREFVPCSDHPQGWSRGLTVPLPSNWNALRKLVRASVVCAWCGELGTEVDHIKNRAEGGTDDLSNLQLLCVSCHTEKTREEAKRGQRRHQ